MNTNISEEDTEFFNIIGSREVKKATVIAILRNLRAKPVGEMDDNECRSVLATCQAFAVMNNFEQVFFPKINEGPEEEPDDY